MRIKKMAPGIQIPQIIRTSTKKPQLTLSKIPFLTLSKTTGGCKTK